MNLSGIKSKYLGDMGFYKMALAIAIPIMIQNGITQFVGLLDNIMIGRVGTEQMTGVSIANTLLFVYSLAIFGAVSGAGIFGAQFFGSKDTSGVRFVFRFKLIVALLITVLGIGVFLLFDEPLIMLYLRGEGTPQQIALSLVYAKDYLKIMLIGLVPFALTQCYTGTLREGKQTLVPMVSGIAAVVLNLLFNALLIFGYLGFPALGVRGAAIATVISRFVELAVVSVWTHRNPQKMPFIVSAFKSMRIPLSLAKKMARKSLPLLINETLWSVGLALMTQCYSTLGYNVVSAQNITNTLGNVFNVAFIAMGNSIGIILGQLLGANKPKEAALANRRLTALSMAISVVVMAAMAALSQIFPLAYNTSNDIRALASSMILIYAATTPLNCFANACYFTLRSGGKTLITFLFDGCFVCVVSVPVALFLTHVCKLDILWLYFICQSVYLIKCILGEIFVRKGIWINNIVS